MGLPLQTKAIITPFTARGLAVQVSAFKRLRNCEASDLPRIARYCADHALKSVDADAVVDAVTHIRRIDSGIGIDTIEDNLRVYDFWSMAKWEFEWKSLNFIRADDKKTLFANNRALALHEQYQFLVYFQNDPMLKTIAELLGHENSWFRVLGILVNENELQDPSGTLQLTYTTTSTREASYFAPETFVIVEGVSGKGGQMEVTSISLPSSSRMRREMPKCTLGNTPSKKVTEATQDPFIAIFRGARDQHSHFLRRVAQIYEEKKQPSLFVFLPTPSTYDQDLDIAKSIFPEERVLVLQESAPLSLPIRVVVRGNTIMIVPGGTGKDCRGRCLFTSKKNSNIPKVRENEVSEARMLAKVVATQASCRPWKWQGDVDFAFRLFPNVNRVVLGEQMDDEEVDGIKIGGVPIFPHGWLHIDVTTLEADRQTF